MLPATGLQFAPARRVSSLDECYFYHTLELPDLGVVKGEWDLRGRFAEYTGHVDFRGKSVLDVGTASGFLSFEAERSGADVVSFDIGPGAASQLLPFSQNESYRHPERWAEMNGRLEKMKNGYWLAHRLLESRCRVFYGNVYDLPSALGTFDIVLVCAVLEHVADPISALASISRVSGHTLVIGTEILPNDDPIAKFVPRANNPQMDFTWWYYSAGVYREVLGMLGYTIATVQTGRYLYCGTGQMVERHTLVAHRTD